MKSLLQSRMTTLSFNSLNGQCVLRISSEFGTTVFRFNDFASEKMSFDKIERNHASIIELKRDARTYTRPLNGATMVTRTQFTRTHGATRAVFTFANYRRLLVRSNDRSAGGVNDWRTARKKW